MESQNQPTAASNQPAVQSEVQASEASRPLQDGDVVTGQEAQPLATPSVSLPPEHPIPGNNGIVLPNPNDTFAALQHIVYNNGALTNPGMMIPPNPQMIGLNSSVIEQPTNGNSLSAEDIALYDRQLRLWGMEAQQKIQSASIVIITMKALANEIAKNLVLAGIGSLTVVDDQVVTEADLGAQFFLSEENIGQNRAEAAVTQIQKLNPRVKVTADSGSIMNKGASFFGNFDIVIATDLSPTLLAFINTATRLHHRQFYAAGTHGFYGYIFCDLIEHDYVLQRDKPNVPTAVGPETRTRSVVKVEFQKEGGKTIEKVQKRELYSTWDLASDTSMLPPEYLKSKRRLRAVTPALSCLRALWAFQQAHDDRYPDHNKQDLEFFTRSATHNHALLSLPAETLRSEFLRSFLQNIGSEIAPVTAALGGQLAQDVINVRGQRQQPLQNMVIFDGDKMEAEMYPLHPEGNLGRAQLELTSSIMPPGQVDTSQMIPMDHATMIMGTGV
ncbi:E1 ubiquitin-activating protein aos1 [Parahypoxylon ruwenzoriense]